ncbi:MAG TPA: hypothetical protein VE974_20960 [Thermoanaerobaculia bacterium]|nr:hypothetical protein [Thermoanaerobaculia bacterium]
MTSTRTFPGTGPLQSESRAGGGVTLYEYDDRARVSAIMRGFSATDLLERIETTYDPDTGRKNLERMLARDGAAWVEKSRTSYRYDLFARLDQVTNADNSTVGYAYDSAGRIVSVRDENHPAPNTFYEYDTGGRLAEVRQALASAAGGFVTTLYSYDRDGNLVSVTDPNGNVTTYVYDDFGQLLRQDSPVSGATVYTYNAAGDLTSSIDANGAASTRTYDVLGRVLTNVATRGSESETIAWTYDAGTFGIGRISSVVEPTGSTTYAYDRRGLLQQEQKTIRGTTYTTAFRYDQAGNRTAMTYPSGNVVTYTFDYAGRPQSAVSGTATIVASAKYLPFGPRTELVLGNGTTRRTSYDQRYRPLVNELITTGGTIARYAYTHDAAGNVMAILDQIDHAYDRTFGYDDLNRLTVANSGAALWGSGSYVYDAMGNLESSALGARTRQFAYSGNTPRLTSVTAAGAVRPVTYDAAGNETIDGATYSPRNSLAGNDPYGYAYDARGVRTITEFASTGTLVSIAAAPAAVRGGESVQGTVTLTEPAPAG